MFGGEETPGLWLKTNTSTTKQPRKHIDPIDPTGTKTKHWRRVIFFPIINHQFTTHWPWLGTPGMAIYSRKDFHKIHDISKYKLRKLEIIGSDLKIQKLKRVTCLGFVKSSQSLKQESVNPEILQIYMSAFLSFIFLKFGTAKSSRGVLKETRCRRRVNGRSSWPRPVRAHAIQSQFTDFSQRVAVELVAVKFCLLLIWHIFLRRKGFYDFIKWSE